MTTKHAKMAKEKEALQGSEDCERRADEPEEWRPQGDNLQQLNRERKGLQVQAGKVGNEVQHPTHGISGDKDDEEQGEARHAPGSIKAKGKAVCSRLSLVHGQLTYSVKLACNSIWGHLDGLSEDFKNVRKHATSIVN